MYMLYLYQYFEQFSRNIYNLEASSKAIRS